MIRFIAKAAIAAAAAGVMAAGVAAPAMAAEATAPVVEGGYENHETDSGGVDLRSDLCIGGLSGDVGLDLDLSDITNLDLFATTDVDSDCDSQSQVLIDIRP